MLGLFGLSKKVKQLKKLGHTAQLAQYQAQRNNNQLNKVEYRSKIENLWLQQQNNWHHRDNVNVATRQSFTTNETLVPLNLEQIQTEVYDIDFIKNKLFFDYKNQGSVNYALVTTLKKALKADEQFASMWQESEIQKQVFSEPECIEILTSTYHINEYSSIRQALLQLLEKK